MSLVAQREQVWVAPIDDAPGGLYEKLTALAQVGVNLTFVIARRADNDPGKGVVFVTPITGDRQRQAATEAGFHASSTMHAVRVEGADRAGLGEVITQKLADAGLNLRGLSAASIDGKCVMHLALDTEADAAKALDLMQHVR